MTRLRSTALTACLLLAALAGCGDSDTTATSTSTAGDTTVSSPAADSNGSATAELLESGFGQRDEYVSVIAMVKNTSDKVGQTVTVQFNLKDAAGEILASESQVETFSRVGQTRPVLTQADVPAGKKVAAVDATLLVQDSGAFTAEEYPEIPAGKVTVAKGEYGSGWTARVQVTNPKAEPLSSPRVDVVCRNAANKIVGGAFTFPELVPPSGKAVVNLDLLIGGKAKPASCIAYAQPPIA